MKDLVSHLKIVQSLAPAARTASANGATVDRRGFNSCVFKIEAGAYTDGTHTPKAQESDNGSDWTDVAAADLSGSFTAIAGSGQQNAIYTVGYKGTRRYVRPVITAAGTSSGAVTSAAVILSHAESVPVAA